MGVSFRIKDGQFVVSTKLQLRRKEWRIWELRDIVRDTIGERKQTTISIAELIQLPSQEQVCLDIQADGVYKIIWNTKQGEKSVEMPTTWIVVPPIDLNDMAVAVITGKNARIIIQQRESARPWESFSTGQLTPLIGLEEQNVYVFSEE